MRSLVLRQPVQYIAEIHWRKGCFTSLLAGSGMDLRVTVLLGTAHTIEPINCGFSGI